MRKINKTQLLDALRFLASRDFQIRAWFASSGPEVASFTEQIAQTFDDTGLSDTIDGKSMKDELGNELAEAILELDRAVDGVDASMPPATLIDHPSMTSVRQAAQRAAVILEGNES